MFSHRPQFPASHPRFLVRRRLLLFHIRLCVLKFLFFIGNFLFRIRKGDFSVGDFLFRVGKLGFSVGNRLLGFGELSFSIGDRLLGFG